MDSTQSLQTYYGNCHCGAFRFSVKFPSLKEVSRCHCSFCTKNGYLWIFPDADNEFVVEKGEEGLKEYRVVEKSLRHLFCPICGSSVMARNDNEDTPTGEGILARMLRDIDLETLTIKAYICLDAGLKPPQVTYPEMKNVEDGLKLYNGNCQCGAVTYAVKTRPLSEQKVMWCNCSLCSRNGDHWIYPPKTSIILHGGYNLTDYAFLSEDSLHSFCCICGVSMVVRCLDEKDDEMPVNVRTMEGVDRVVLEGLEYIRYDGRGNGREYGLRN